MNRFLRTIQKFLNVKPRGIPILMYHYIDDIPVPSAIDPDLFRKEMVFIKENCNPITMGDLIEHMKGQKTLQNNSVLITFDDGTADFYYNVLPVIKRLNILVVLYITTGYIRSYMSSLSHNWKYKMLTWDEVREISHQNRKSSKIRSGDFFYGERC